MKKLWLPILILYMVAVSCEKDIVVEPIIPPVSVEKPKVELTITPSEVMVPYGAKCIVAWATDPKNTCKINDIVVNPVDSKEVQLFESKKYTAFVSNGVNSNSVEKNVTVGDWKTSKLGLLTYKPFMLKNKKIWQNGKVVFDFLLAPNELTNVFQNLTDGTVVVHDSTGKLIAQDEWAFDKDETHYLTGSQTILIYSLTESEFILRSEASFNGAPAIYEISYYRP